MNDQCSRMLPTVLGPVRRIIAIGDIHGDFKILRKCLRLAGVINKDRKWIGGDTVVIQMGDQIDSKCRASYCEKDEVGDELRILKFVDQLHLEAEKEGGAFYSLLGNHELMNVMGNLNYVSSEGAIGFGGNKKERLNKFAPSGEIAIYLACNRNSIMKIGDFLFVHGGLLPKKAKQYSLERINQIIKEYLLGKKSIADPMVTDLLHGKESPFWTRTFSRFYKQDHPDKCEMLNETLEYLNVRGMVVGHTVQKQGINSACENRIWRTDIGLSRSFGGNPDEKKVQVLEILNNGQQINILK